MAAVVARRGIHPKNLRVYRNSCLWLICAAVAALKRKGGCGAATFGGRGSRDLLYLNNVSA